MESASNLPLMMSSANAMIGTIEQAIRTMQIARARIAGGGDAAARVPAQSYSSDESFTDARSCLAESEAVCEERCAFSRRKLQVSVECAVWERARRIGHRYRR